MKKRNIKIAIITFLLLFIIDRFTWMPERVKILWRYESGYGFGDPIAYNQDFILNGSEILFKEFKQKEEFPVMYHNRQSKFYLLGCYFGKLYIYDTIKHRITVYEDY